MIKPNLYIFQWISDLGGSDTRLKELLILLKNDFAITCVPNDEFRLNEKNNTDFLDSHGIKYSLMQNLPKKMEGFGYANCNFRLFSEQNRINFIHESGLKFLWSNDMMWEFKGEAEAVREGLVSRVIFVSDVQRTAFHDMYMGIEQRLIPNYVAPGSFPLVERKSSTFAIGRLSRPDPVKYPVDFPVFYESLGLEDVCYRVQAWSEELRKKYAWHRFGPEWNLLPANKIPAAEFLSQLDLFVYPLGNGFVESWGRSTVEAMLTGCVPLVPRGHNFEQMMLHGESGFICGSFAEFKVVTQELYGNRALRLQIGRQAAHHARTVLCNEEEHRMMWLEALTF